MLNFIKRESQAIAIYSELRRLANGLESGEIKAVQMEVCADTEVIGIDDTGYAITQLTGERQLTLRYRAIS